MKVTLALISALLLLIATKLLIAASSETKTSNLAIDSFEASRITSAR